MTALCPGGAASQQKPGTPVYIGASLALIDLGLVDLFGPAGAVLSGAIDGFIWNSVQNCATDPPGFPTWTDADWQNATLGQLSAGFPALRTKVNNAILTWLWYQYCQCVPPAATPAQPAPSNPPPSTIIGVAPPVCGSFDFSSTFPGGSLPTQIDPRHPIPTGATSYFISTVFSPQVWTCSGGGIGHNVNELSSTGTLVQSDGGPANYPTGFGFNSIFSHTATINSGAAYLQIQNAGPNNSDCPTITASSHLVFYCQPSGSGTVAGQPCVPCTDPALLTLVSNNNLLLRQILNALPGQQTGWIESTIHSNLSGDGAISVGALTRAVRVNITTDNVNLRTGHGDPTYLFDRGFIVPIGSEGSTRNLVRLVYNPQLYVLPPLTTQVGYSTGVGITISITELLASP